MADFEILHRVVFENSPNSKIEEMLENLLESTLLTLKNTETIMAQNEKVLALVEDFKVATDEIAKDLEQIRADYAAGTVTDEALAMFDAQVQRLKALGQDPSDPVPDTSSTSSSSTTEDTSTEAGGEPSFGPNA